MKIQSYFTLMQYLKLKRTRTDRGLNFMAVLHCKLHQGHR